MHLRKALLLAVAILCAEAALELPWNPGFLTAIAPLHLALELALVALVVLFGYFACGRRWGGAAAGVVACAVVGLGQYYLERFKGTAVLPSDLYALGTAATVAGNYDYTLGLTAAAGLAAMAVGIAACALMRKGSPLMRGADKGAAEASDGAPDAKADAAAATDAPSAPAAAPDVEPSDAATHEDTAAHDKGIAAPTTGDPAHRGVSRRDFCVSLAGAAGTAAVFAGLVGIPDYEKAFGLKIDGWDALSSYKKQGILPSFVEAYQHMGIVRPEGWTAEGAQALEEGYAARYADERAGLPRTRLARAQYDATLPSILVVMNETFADLSMYKGLEVGYEGPRFFNGMDDCLTRGKLAVSAYAGGTCNTEFEFLCGSALTYVGSGKYPYTLYDLEDCANLAGQLGQAGYETTAIHPNLGSNWSREDVYRGFGFDRFLTIDDFKGAPVFHSGVTDRATYEAALEQIEKGKGPQLVFDVTMQNHSGYDQHNIPSQRLTSYDPAFLDDEQKAELNEYLSCIKAADADLEWLVGRLRELSKPCILVFFGDHQPSVSGFLNDALFTDDGEPEHGSRGYMTDYLVWANYDVAGASGMRREDASSSCLAALALEAAGAPLTSWQQAQLIAHDDLTMMNLFAYRDSAGDWHSAKLDAPAPADESAEAARARQAFQDLAWIQYLEFATKVH